MNIKDGTPSVERREEVIAAWMEGGGQTWRFDGKTEPELEVDRDFLFWNFIASLDAQSAERTRAEVEKMREDEREKVAKWMIQHGFATGHGDTIEDLLGELAGQILRHMERDVENRNVSRET